VERRKGEGGREKRKGSEKRREKREESKAGLCSTLEEASNYNHSTVIKNSMLSFDSQSRPTCTLHQIWQ
jgi:hypothetical protein